MAEKKYRLDENAPGKYYVDDSCIASKFCVGTASENFAMNDSGLHAYVRQQPRTDLEKAQVEEALRGCPVDAIGNDGQD